MRRSFTAHASLLVCDILGLPRVSLVSRCAIILVSFFISGVMHTLVSPMPLFCAGSRIMLFYCGLGGVVILESLMMEFGGRYSGMIERKGLTPFLHFCGYVWVAVFHVWTTAKVLYPSMVCIRQLMREERKG